MCIIHAMVENTPDSTIQSRIGAYSSGVHTQETSVRKMSRRHPKVSALKPSDSAEL